MLSRDMEDIKKTQIEHVEMKATVQEMKSVLNGSNGRLGFVEENIRECENIAIETI